MRTYVHIFMAQSDKNIIEPKARNNLPIIYIHLNNMVNKNTKVSYNKPQTSLEICKIDLTTMLSSKEKNWQMIKYENEFLSKICFLNRIDDN